MTDWIDGTDGLRYAYDSNGRLTQITDYGDSTLTYTYDAAGRVVTMNDCHSHETAYTYTDTVGDCPKRARRRARRDC